MTNLQIASYNCNGINKSMHDVISLCNSQDIICLQETWLLPPDLPFLNSILKDFNAIGYSAVDISNNIIVGRNIGGTAVLFKKRYTSAI